jgi:hypothetical protein
MTLKNNFFQDIMEPTKRDENGLKSSVNKSIVIPEYILMFAWLKNLASMVII